MYVVVHLSMHNIVKLYSEICLSFSAINVYLLACTEIQRRYCTLGCILKKLHTKDTVYPIHYETCGAKPS